MKKKIKNKIKQSNIFYFLNFLFQTLYLKENY